MNYGKNSKKEFLLKEIEIIQDIIKRMAFCSLIIKGYTMILIVMVFLLERIEYQIWIIFIPLMAFWFLDSYFLQQERLYRKLYEWVINNRLKTEDYLFDLNIYRFRNEIQPKIMIMFSITLSWFYGSILILSILFLFL